MVVTVAVLKVVRGGVSHSLQEIVVQAVNHRYGKVDHILSFRSLLTSAREDIAISGR